VRRPARARSLPGFVLLALLAATQPAEAQTPRPSCESCHGELEFLRQHKGSLEEARTLLAPAAVLAASAHGAMTCTDCHDGFRRFPHPETSTTKPCASCHEEMAAKWREGMHALDDAVECRDCHGTHDVLGKAALATPEGIHAIRAACTACHYAPGIPASDPHVASVSCAGCHEPHATLPAEDERASTHVLNQAKTCGACHQEQAAAWSQDAHARAVPEVAMPGGRVPEGASRAEAPSCTGCHGSHGITPPSAPGFRDGMIERCSHCHERYSESFADSYHGQAATLGSEAVATCHDCHGSHGVQPASDPRSTVNEANLLGTCKACHKNATAGFALFQPHADHSDKERYPYVYWSYHLMTALLVGTFALFGIHTVLWVGRLSMDALRGTSHDSHHDIGG
jgi:hypothetical protein